MSAAWWLLAFCILVAFHYAMRFGSEIVQRRTGRECRPEQSSLGYDAVFFGLAFCIGMPPIFLFPDADSLVYSGFLILGILVGSLTSQALFGRTTA
jgi:hypothetical protein